jgi:epoxyqueuosine reductase QueG
VRRKGKLGNLSPGLQLISKRTYRHISQSVCPWNVKFSQELAEDSPFRAREFVAGKDAVTLARDILALDQQAFSAAFRQSPMKRPKLVGLQRNAAVALVSTGASSRTLKTKS